MEYERGWYMSVCLHLYECWFYIFHGPSPSVSALDRLSHSNTSEYIANVDIFWIVPFSFCCGFVVLTLPHIYTHTRTTLFFVECGNLNWFMVQNFRINSHTNNFIILIENAFHNQFPIFNLQSYFVQTIMMQIC